MEGRALGGVGGGCYRHREAEKKPAAQDLGEVPRKEGCRSHRHLGTVCWALGQSRGACMGTVGQEEHTGYRARIL